MKKRLNIIVILLISFLMVGINVDAATGTGVCSGKQIIANSGGYCKLDTPAMIRSQVFAKRPIMLTNGKDSVKYAYRGGVNGIEEDMFCLDSNLTAPGSTPYTLARPLNLNEDYDRAIAKVYSMYVNDSAYLMNSRGISFEAASQEYLQVTNIVVRALTKKYKYDIVGDYQFRSNIYNNVYAQFEGKPGGAPKLVEGTAAYKLAQKYYCSAILSCKECNKVGDAVTFCEKLPNVSKTKVRDFNVKVESTPEIEQIDTGNSEEFSRIIEMKITGLNSFTTDYATYAQTNPYFKVTDVKCENQKLNCEIESGLVKDVNILPGLKGNEYKFKVRITGNKKDFLTETSGKVTVNYEFHHIFNSNNLAVLRYSIAHQEKQRMISLMPKRAETSDVSVSFPIPALCQMEIVKGKPIYKYDGEEVTETEYLDAGCCNVKPALLKTKEANEHYFESCDVDKNIYLDTQCDNNRENNIMSHSFVRQEDMDKVIRKISDIEKNAIAYEDDAYKDVMKNFNHHLDDNYLYSTSRNDNTTVSRGNKYCKMYTSEKLEIYYPGTAEATSGRFFIFKEDKQPYVDGRITGLFHTNIDKWEKDYQSAIDTEVASYNALESAKNDPEITDISSYEDKYEQDKAYRLELQKYKKECEDKSDVKNKWQYQLEPDLYFNYHQKFYDPLTNKTEEITEQVELEVSYRKEKYWPGISDREPIQVERLNSGDKSYTYKTIPYGNHERFEYDRTEDYQTGYTQRLYYIPKIKYYSLVPSGKYVTQVNEYQATNALDVGYVFNVKITTYEGEYQTWFTINNVGHLMQNSKNKPKNISNIQTLLNEYLAENKDLLDIVDIKNKIDGSKFVNKCLYYDEEILYSRECPTCEDDLDFKSSYFSKIVANNKLFPNEGTGERVTGANWSTEKAKDAKKLIESAGNQIYGDADGAKSYLDYSIRLTPKKMQKTRKYNKTTTYSDFNLKCFEGKECKSEFLTNLLEEDSKSEHDKKSLELLHKTRQSGWKYYVNKVWDRGSIADLLNGKYPEPDAGLPDWP